MIPGFAPAGLYRLIEEAKAAAAEADTILETLQGTLTDPEQVASVKEARNGLRNSDLAGQGIVENGGDREYIV